MITINLLPWRERIIEKKKRQFFGICAAVVAVALLTNGIIYLVEGKKVTAQLARNSLLQAQINLLNTSKKQQQKLDDKKTELFAQMQTLVTLNNQRIKIAELLNTLPKLLPENVYLSSLSVDENKVTLQGEAPASTQASALIENIKKQAGWKNASLEEMSSSNKAVGKSLFRITFQVE